MTTPVAAAPLLTDIPGTTVPANLPEDLKGFALALGVLTKPSSGPGKAKGLPPAPPVVEPPTAQDLAMAVAWSSVTAGLALVPQVAAVPAVAAVPDVPGATDAPALSATPSTPATPATLDVTTSPAVPAVPSQVAHTTEETPNPGRPVWSP